MKEERNFAMAVLGREKHSSRAMMHKSRSRALQKML